MDRLPILQKEWAAYIYWRIGLTSTMQSVCNYDGPVHAHYRFTGRVAQLFPNI